jgi:hypothetical protein
VDAIKSQTVESNIIIWDNSGELDDIAGVTIIKSSHNFVCRPRFLIPGLVNTEFIFNQDDDHIITDDKLFEKLIKECEDHEGYFIGWPARKNYKTEPFEKKADGLYSDFVNTGNSFYKTSMINNLPINPYQCKMYELTEEEYRYADDHFVSKHMIQCRTSISLFEGMAKLEDYETGISRESKHIEIREKIAERYFK